MNAWGRRISRLTRRFLRFIGWEHTVIHELKHFLEAIVTGKDVSPYGATFEDGYKCAVICDAILKSAETGQKIEIKY